MSAVCPIPSCGRSFNSVSALMRHTEDLHGKAKVLKGVKAWESNRQQQGILTTRNSSVNDNEILIDDDAYCYSSNTWDCGICRREFDTRKALTQHANSGVHSDNSYRCDDCGRKFKALASLYSHVDATNCRHVRHVTNTLGSDYQQGNNFLKITNGSAHEAVLYFDGGAQPNPGDGGAGFVLYDGHGNVLEERSCDVIHYSKCTSNQAEYCGLILGLRCANRFHIRSLKVKGDSKLVINQMNNKWRVKSEKLQELNQCANVWEEQFRRVSYEWIPREKNGKADELAREGVWREGDIEQYMDDVINSA